MAAEARVVSHIERKAPVIRKPRIIKRVSFPVDERIKAEILLPNPDLLMKAARVSTPRKKTTISFPNPVRIISVYEPTRVTVRSIIAKNPVIWKGSASVIQSTRLKTRTAKEARAGFPECIPSIYAGFPVVALTDREIVSTSEAGGGNSRIIAKRSTARAMHTHFWVIRLLDIPIRLRPID
jgi:hypothetical protein